MARITINNIEQYTKGSNKTKREGNWDTETTGANEILTLFHNYASENVNSNSVVDKLFADISKTQPQLNQQWSTNFYSQLLTSLGIDTGIMKNNVAFIPTNKKARLWDYYRMAEYSDISVCIDEIADGCVNFNEKKRCVDITFNSDNYEYESLMADNSSEKQEIDEERRKLEAKLYKEFFKFIAPLNLNSELYRYIRNYAITGECCWELEVDPDNEDAGVIGFRFLPTHSYDYAYDVNTKKKVGIYVKILQTQPGSSLNMDDGDAGNAWNSNFATNYSNSYGALNCSADIASGDAIFLPFDEVLYVNTGNYSPDELTVYPLIEMARKIYNQLVCIEDAIIVYRLARSPTRLVFNVDVGTMTQTKGTGVLQQMIRKYNTQKRYNPNTGTMENYRDPHTMTESYWFLKNNGQNGTTVEELTSSVDMGELPDLLYFQRKLWLAMKVPSARFIDAGSNPYQRAADSITPEEYRFCKMIIRQLSRFAGGIKKAFITHLKLRGWWEQYELSENDFEISFVNPISYEIAEQARVLKERLEMYDAIAGHDEFSKTVAMKMYLNMNDAEIENNWVEMEKDMMRQKLIEAKAEKLAEREVTKWEEELNQKDEAEKQAGEDDEYSSTDDAVEDAVDTEKIQTTQQPIQTQQTPAQTQAPQSQSDASQTPQKQPTQDDSEVIKQPDFI